MTRTATISLCLVIAAVFVFRFSQLQRRVSTVPSPENADESADGAVILPAVSSGWSNLTRQGSATSTQITKVETVSSPTGNVAAVTAEEVNSEAVAARARELLAQSALSSVGVDPDADQYWLAAINDPGISAAERQELILALNEAGLAEPKRLSANDLALIAGRIALLEEVGTHPMDAVNAAAFEETYRELLNMFAVVTGPEPAAVEGTGE